MAGIRLCLVVELTAKHGSLWATKTLPLVVEPLLALLEAGDGSAAACELALVLFGAHPPHSLAAVESCLRWCTSVQQLRSLLDGLRFVGGGAQAVALAEALAEAAALFALPPHAVPGQPAAAWQQQCLVCLASDPAVHPVPWPFPEDCCMAKLPGLATSIELYHAFRRRGIRLGMAGSGLLTNVALMWHLVNLTSDVPISLDETRPDMLKAKHDAARQRMLGAALGLPGGGMAVLPFWPQGTEVLQQAGAKLLSREPSNTSDASRFKAGDSLETAVLDTEDAAAKAARGGGLGSGPSPGATPLWTPPIATHATPPATGATPPMIHASPGGFWEVLNAQIYSPDLAPPPAAAAALPAAAPPGMHEPTVTGLPLPPCQQQQQQQQQLGGMRLAALPGTATQDDGRGACSVSIYSANLIVDTKGGGSLVLGVGTLQCKPQDTAMLRSLSWPPELHITKTLPRGAIASFLQNKQQRWTTLLDMQYASLQAQNFPEKLLVQNAVGLVTLSAGVTGLLHASRNKQTQQVALWLLVVR